MFSVMFQERYICDLSSKKSKAICTLYLLQQVVIKRAAQYQKNISPMEPCAEYCISWKPNNVGRLANNKEFGFQTFSLTSQYAVLYALNTRSSLTSFFSCTFLEWNIETCHCISDSIGSVCCWILSETVQRLLCWKFCVACIRNKTFLFLLVSWTRFHVSVLVLGEQPVMYKSVLSRPMLRLFGSW